MRSVVFFVIYFFPPLGKESFLRGVFSVNVSAIGLGLAIVGIEVGISLAGILCIVMGWAFDHAGLTISTKPRII